MARQREIHDKLSVYTETLQSRELTDEEKGSKAVLEAEYEDVTREVGMSIQATELAKSQSNVPVDVNKELREFFREAKPGRQFSIPRRRESISYGSQGAGHYPGTGAYVQGITVVDLINTERPDNDILLTAGVPMTTGVTGNKIQWAFAGGVEAVFANELAATTERVINLDKQNPIQNRLTVRVRISNQAIENTEFDLQAYIVKVVSDAIRKKINFAAASPTKAATYFYGGFAQDTESGTYGQAGYTPGKQVGTFTTFTKETAAEMLGKLAVRNIGTDTAVFVINEADFWTLKATAFDQGSGIMLIGPDNRLLGIPVVHTNAIGAGNIGLGVFKYLPVMQHGNIRLTIDATSAVASSTDEVITTINADFSMTVLKAGADAFVLYSKSTDSSSAI